MGWEDRSYYRDRPSRMGNPLMWARDGSVPLFTVAGIRVRAHAALVIFVIGMLVLGELGWQDRVESMSILFAIVLLHEFGHCFTARAVGGEAEDILMTPFGGLAMARPPHRPLPTFLTVAGGPAVNVVICIACAAVLYVLGGYVTLNPFNFWPRRSFDSWLDLYRYAFWIFHISWLLLLFNLMPIYPLDGGQMLQAILWPRFGYYKSMLFSCVTGMIGAVLIGMVGLSTLNWMLVAIALSGFMTCRAMRLQVLSAGPYGFQDEANYSASLYNTGSGARRKVASRAVSKAQKRERLDRIEQRKIDTILAKVSAQGMNQLTWWEKRTLRKATERQRQADLAHARRTM